MGKKIPGRLSNARRVKKHYIVLISHKPIPINHPSAFHPQSIQLKWRPGTGIFVTSSRTHQTATAPILNHKGSSGKLLIIRNESAANRTMWADVRRTLSLTCSVFARARLSAPLSSPGWWLKNISIIKTTKNTIFKISSTPQIK